LPERGRKEEPPSDVELDIIRSFGWSLMEVEDTLYQRFLHLSANRSLVSRVKFRKYLMEMEAKAYLSPVHIQGLKGYKKLRSEISINKSLDPRVPLDEIRLVIGSKKAKPKFQKKKTPAKVTRDLFQMSEELGSAIQTELEKWMLNETGRISKGLVHEHMKNMCSALEKSEEDLFEYVHAETPGILIEVGQILRSQGPDFLLLTLRLTESNVRKYSF